MESVSRYFSDPGRSYFLFGPRGTGKSTWLRREYPDALWVDLLDPETDRRFRARPERLIELVRGRPDAGVVVVDEVQKVPALLYAVHLLVEQRPSLRFVLTGSSARKLRRSEVDLLAGRASLSTMHPFMASELGDRFDLDEALRRGLVPVVVDADDPDDVLRNYAALYLREEVQVESLVRNVGAFARFLESICLSHMTVLNISSVARECQVERKVVQGYIDILEDLLLAVRLPVFAKRARRTMTVHPKLMLFDTGVFLSLRPYGPLDRPEEIGGQALEGLVAQHLLAWIAYGGSGHRLYHWRTRGGSEVDLVLYGPDGLWAIEVKSTRRRLHPRDIRGLRAFGEDYPEARRLILYRGDDVLQRDDGIAVIPVDTFLRQLVPGRSLWTEDGR
jgi:predicted AAA+ superfamily ATPase